MCRSLIRQAIHLTLEQKSKLSAKKCYKVRLTTSPNFYSAYKPGQRGVQTFCGCAAMSWHGCLSVSCWASPVSKRIQTQVRRSGRDITHLCEEKLTIVQIEAIFRTVISISIRLPPYWTEPLFKSVTAAQAEVPVNPSVGPARGGMRECRLARCSLAAAQYTTLPTLLWRRLLFTSTLFST